MPPDSYWEKFCDVEALHLQETSKQKIYEALSRNPTDLSGEDDTLSDWEGFAEEMHGSFNMIENWGKKKHPEEEVFKFYATERSMTIGKLLSVMREIGLEDDVDQLRKDVEKDVEAFLQNEKTPIQVSPVFSVQCEEEKMSLASPFQDKGKQTNTAVKEGREWALKLLEGEVENYDAFISFNMTDEKDLKFAVEMVEFLENCGYKIFMRGVDDAGGARFDEYSDLIRNRCRKVIIVLSPSFSKCEECDWVLKFAQSLSPGARKAILLPILRTSDSRLPDIINFLSFLDAERDLKHNWFNRRLLKLLGPPSAPPSGAPSRPPPELPAGPPSGPLAGPPSVSSAVTTVANSSTSSASADSSITATATAGTTTTATVGTTATTTEIGLSQTNVTTSEAAAYKVVAAIKSPSVSESNASITSSSLPSSSPSLSATSSSTSLSATSSFEVISESLAPSTQRETTKISPPEIPELSYKSVTSATPKSTSHRNNGQSLSSSSRRSFGLGKLFKKS